MHSYTQQSDENKHWRECSECNHKTQEETHTFDNDSWSYSETDATSGHYHICMYCGGHSAVTAHTFDNDCDTTCNDCDYVRTVASHTYSKELSVIGDHHGYICTTCDSIDESSYVEHTYEDGICSECGHIENMCFTYNWKTESYTLSSGSSVTAKTVVIPNTYNDGINGSHPVTSIDEYAFSDCTNITSITMGNNITSIGEYAFKKCTGLTNVTIGSGITDIKYRAFYDCTSLTKVNYLGTIEQWVGIKFKDFMSNPTSFAKALYIDDNLVTTVNLTMAIEIYNYVFYNCTSITSVTMGDSITSIGQSAFSDCTGLTSVTMGDSVTDIDNAVFYGCTMLTSITLGNNVTSIGGYLFYKCTALTSVVIPNSATKIDDYAFYECTSLSSVTIGNSVASIGKEAFYNCSEITSLTIPDSVTSIGKEAFSYCSALTKVNYLGTIDQWAEISFTDRDSNPAYYTKALYIDNKLVITVNLTTATKVSDYAFFDYGDITKVTIGSSVTSIGDYAFAGCSGLMSVTIDDGVTSIGDYAFYGCTRLASITIPDSVKTIGEYAFYSCKSLTRVVIPNSVTSLRDYAFYACYRLTSVVIGNGLTRIEDYMFGYCTDLTDIIIPNSVTYIDRGVFYLCNNLANVYFVGTSEEWFALGINYATHNGTNANISISVPEKYFYVEKEADVPTGIAQGYWHYDTDGITPVVW